MDDASDEIPDERLLFEARVELSALRFAVAAMGGFGACFFLIVVLFALRVEADLSMLGIDGLLLTIAVSYLLSRYFSDRLEAYVKEMAVTFLRIATLGIGVVDETEQIAKRRRGDLRTVGVFLAATALMSIWFFGMKVWTFDVLGDRTPLAVMLEGDGPNRFRVLLVLLGEIASGFLAVSVVAFLASIYLELVAWWRGSLARLVWRRVRSR